MARNWPLLIKVIIHIIEHPETWNQRFYATVCGTSFCVAGHAAILSGYKFAVNSMGYTTDLVKVEEGVYDAAYIHTGYGSVIRAETLGHILLGLDADDSDYLFDQDRTLEEILAAVDRWATDDNIELPEKIRALIPA